MLLRWIFDDPLYRVQYWISPSPPASAALISYPISTEKLCGGTSGPHITSPVKSRPYDTNRARISSQLSGTCSTFYRALHCHKCMVGGVSDGLDVWMTTSRLQSEHAQPRLPRDITIRRTLCGKLLNPTQEHTTHSPEGIERNSERELHEF